MTIIRDALDSFWNQHFWLPANTTWNDFHSNDKVQYADHRDLWYPFPMAVIMLCLRFTLEKYVFTSLALSVGIRPPNIRTITPNEVLEKAFKANKKVTHKEIVGLSKQLDISERQIERWFRIKRLEGKPSTMTKFCESCWKTTYFTCAFIYGVLVLWNKPWLWDISQCWVNYPHQGITNDLWWYYMISITYIISLTISQFFDVVRKDFWQMFVHHIATIFLMIFSWITQWHRVGSLIIMTHDVVDIFLDFAKATKYAKYQKLCDFIFLTFTTVWIVTRLMYFPFWIIHSTIVDPPRVLSSLFPAYYMFNGLLLTLQVLHLYWTFLILRIAYNALYTGKTKGDVRSSSEEDSSSDTSTSTAK